MLNAGGLMSYWADRVDGILQAASILAAAMMTRFASLLRQRFSWAAARQVGGLSISPGPLTAE